MKKQLDCPKVIYEQNIDSLTLQLIESDSEDLIRWQTKLINHKNKNELILSEESKDKGIAWVHYESVGENPKGLYNIANAFLSGKDLIVAYYKFGTLLLQQYHFIDPLKFEMKEIILGGGMALPSYGKMTADAKFARIGNDIFISTCFGQYSSGVRKGLFKLNITNFSATKIVFEAKPILFIGIGMKAKEHLNYLKDKKDRNILTPSLEQELLFLTKYTDEPYYFKQVGMDENSDLRKEVYSYVKSGLDLYFFFEKSDDMFSKENSKLPYTTFQNIEKYSKDVLSFYKPESKEQIKILGYISNDYVSDVGNSGADIFVFYQDNLQRKIKILQYQMYNPTWYIVNYQEVKIEDN